VLQQIAPKYIDTGKAKVVYHYMTFIGPESQYAAEAAECANDQGKFWVFADYVLGHQAGENAGAFSKENLKGFAPKVGLDTTQFNACLDSGKHANAVQQESQQGQALGVRATPTFFINGQKIEGLLSAQQFGQYIDSLQK
jgi:protein-disulfide isomerase